MDGLLHTHQAEHMNIGRFSQGCNIETYVCNDCGKVNVFLTTICYGQDGKELAKFPGKVSDKHIYPISPAPEKIKYVPAKYLHEYNEASGVKEKSPKACALLCRRILEMILADKCHCTSYNLSGKVAEYIKREKPGKLIEDSMGFIVGAGNAMAHDKKNEDDDLIRINVSDCDKLLEALKNVFDHIFVLPKREEKMAQNKQKVTPRR